MYRSGMSEDEYFSRCLMAGIGPQDSPEMSGWLKRKVKQAIKHTKKKIKQNPKTAAVIGTLLPIPTSYKVAALTGAYGKDAAKGVKKAAKKVKKYLRGPDVEDFELEQEIDKEVEAALNMQIPAPDENRKSEVPSWVTPAAVAGVALPVVFSLLAGE